jgi:radical SAM superfamily enzyme YgiQ (UPF0313 family)
MGRRALLVYPQIPATYWSFRYALPFIGKRAAFPPLGLLTVAAMLPEDFEVSLVDMNVSALTEDAVSGADVVFTSSMIVQRDSLLDVIGLCNRCGTPVVAGGPYPTSSHRLLDGVDHFVLNEAEVTLPRFLEDYLEGRAKPLYSDTARPDLALTPPPRFDLIRLSDYANMALQYSRGCPHECEFCDIVEMFGRVPRTKAPGQFIAELEGLYATGWRGALFVVDDNFIGNRKAVKTLLREVAAWQEARDFPFLLFTEATVGLARDDELMGLMRRAGFNMVFLGIETPVEETLAEVGKHQNLRLDMVSAVRRIQRAGMEVSGGFVLGFDNDPPDIFERQVAFIQEAAIPTAMVGLLTAVPGTRLHRRLEAEGRLTAESSGNNTHDFSLDFTPVMDADTLLRGYKGVLAEIYRPARYFARCLDLLRALQTHRASRRRVTATELRALFLSLLVQTFSRYGFQYWKFLLRAFLMRPTMISETVGMAIKGHHFFKMTRRVLAVEDFKRYVERLVLAFQRKAAEASWPDLQRKAAELKVYRDRTLADLRAKYRRLHADFQGYAEQSVERAKARMDEVLAGLGPQASPTGGL